MEYDAEQTTIKMLRKHAVFKDQAVLEIGCGGGETASILAGDTQHYIGIDPDENRIREAQKKYHTVDFRVGNGECLAFEDACFDLVLFTLSLHHQDSAASLKEAGRVLKPNGKLVILEPSVKGEFQQFFHLFNDESKAIQNAYRCMMDSALILEIQSSFEAIVRFDGKTDLCAYEFDRERVAPKDKNLILNQLERLQPVASNGSPIILKDRLDIYLMAKA